MHPTPQRTNNQKLCQSITILLTNYSASINVHYQIYIRQRTRFYGVKSHIFMNQALLGTDLKFIRHIKILHESLMQIDWILQQFDRDGSEIKQFRKKQESHMNKNLKLIIIR